MNGDLIRIIIHVTCAYWLLSVSSLLLGEGNHQLAPVIGGNRQAAAAAGVTVPVLSPDQFYTELRVAQLPGLGATPRGLSNLPAESRLGSSSRGLGGISGSFLRNTSTRTPSGLGATTSNSLSQLRPLNVIGDSTSGGCGGLLIGGALVATIGHPTYACSRLNIAENNSPVVRDRAYLTYRHYHNASIFDVFSYSPQGRASEFDIDQFTFGLEKKFYPNCSLEFRLPIQSQLGSNLTFVQSDSGATTDGSNTNLDDILANGTDEAIGNISLIFKHALFDSKNTYWSGGVGVNIPTAKDIRIRGEIDDEQYQIYATPPAPPGTLINGPVPTSLPLRVTFDGTYENETVNLQPFLAGLWFPSGNVFVQGFAQLDVPLNESPGQVSVDITRPLTTSVADAGEIGIQTLLRLNLSTGVWLLTSSSPRGRFKGIGAMFEVHYTTTLNDPSGVSVQLPLPLPLPGIPSNLDLDVGNLGGRIDSLNMVAGIPIVIGETTIYNGFGVPIRTGFDRGFDFEYSATIDRRF
ncbi:MAG: hypothetical protein KDB27_30665 [Planctomycetales bacterium]|nr:hypothetical protein [Planctomycetales bacterium]